jgi:hypothetical protein
MVSGCAFGPPANALAGSAGITWETTKVMIVTPIITGIRSTSLRTIYSHVFIDEKEKEKRF